MVFMAFSWSLKAFLIVFHQSFEALELFGQLKLPDSGSFNALLVSCPWRHVVSLLEQMEQLEVEMEAQFHALQMLSFAIQHVSIVHDMRGAVY